MKLSELLTVLPFIQNQESFEQIYITDIETDSRRVTDGNLFVCIKGFSTDGHKYVEEAITNGANAIISEEDIKVEIPVIQIGDTIRALAMLTNKFYHYPTSQIPLIGITGTNGKTTVSYMLDNIFRLANKKTSVLGTIETRIGDEIYATSNTTPDSLALQRYFKQMVELQMDQAIMEVSSHALDMGRVYGCDFDSVIFTNLSQDHLDYHQTLEAYLQVKSLLFAQLGNSYNGKMKYAIINNDDVYGNILKKSTSQFVLTYGINKQSDVMATDLVLFPNKTIFRLKSPHGTVKITSRLIGKFNVYNMLAAATASLTSNISLETIKEALESMPSIPGRLETIDVGQDYTVIVDYAHTPDALNKVLKMSRDLHPNRLWAVLGCGGDRDRSKRPQMAAEALHGADQVIFTTDNPRNESPDSIIKDMIGNLEPKNNRFEVIYDRSAAIKHAIQKAEKGDIVLITGKGHENYQEIKGKKYPFDDRNTSRNAILMKEKKNHVI